MAAPKCVRFAPTDEEVFEEFLIPKIANNLQALQGSLIRDSKLYAQDPVFAAKENQPLFLSDNYWYFVTRTALKAGSLKPNRVIDNPIVQGKWKTVGKPKIISRGNTLNLGKMITLDYVNSENLTTGWRQHEYERIVDAPIFQAVVVVRLFYERKLDQTAVLGEGLNGYNLIFLLLSFLMNSLMTF